MKTPFHEFVRQVQQQMGKVQSHVKEQYNKVFTEERKAELKRGISYFNERACVYKEIALLNKNDLQAAVNDMNAKLAKSCKTSSSKVHFHCKIEQGIKWKTTARIICFQVDEIDDDPVVTRYMNVVQFWILRNDILRQVGKKYGRDEENEFQFVDSSGEVVHSEAVDSIPQTNEEGDQMSTSDILNRVAELNSEEIECCICMERKSDVSLSCAHCFCKHCIDSWQEREQRTCPMCRQTFSEEEEYWEMTDAPNKDEMHDYFVSLASGIPSSPSL